MFSHRFAVNNNSNHNQGDCAANDEILRCAQRDSRRTFAALGIFDDCATIVVNLLKIHELRVTGWVLFKHPSRKNAAARKTA